MLEYRVLYSVKMAILFQISRIIVVVFLLFAASIGAASSTSSLSTTTEVPLIAIVKSYLAKERESSTSQISEKINQINILAKRVNIDLPLQVTKSKKEAEDAAKTTPPDLSLASSKTKEAKKLESEATSLAATLASDIQSLTYVISLYEETVKELTSLDKQLSVTSAANDYERAFEINKRLVELRLLSKTLKATQSYLIISASFGLHETDATSDDGAKHSHDTEPSQCQLPKSKLVLEIEQALIYWVSMLFSYHIFSYLI